MIIFRLQKIIIIKKFTHNNTRRKKINDVSYENVGEGGEGIRTSREINHERLGSY